MDWIGSNSELADVCSGLQGQVLGLDTEFVRRSTFFPILALIQIASKDQIWLIDAPQITDWQPLIDQMNARELVMHSASEDLEVFRTSMSYLPNRLFDTQVAAAFVGLGSALSYAALVELLLGEVLEKSQTQSDWLRRPLSEAQQIYAREDVIYLERLHEILTERLEAQNKLAWIKAYTEQTLRVAATDLDPDKAYLKVKGAVNLNPAQLISLAALAAWRERRARELNKPRNWLVRDAEMLKIVRTRPQSRGDLDHSIGMAPESIRRYGQELLALVAEAPPAGELESPPANLEAGDRALVKLLQERVSSLAGEYQMAERLIANRADLEDLVRHRRGLTVAPAMMSDWRSVELTPQILELVDGR